MTVKGSTFKRCGCRDPETGKKLGSKCPKLGSRRHGAWFARYDTPRGPEGKRRQPRIGPYATQKEADRALREALGRVDTGTHTDVARQTFAEYLDQWLAGKVKIKASTRSSYEEHVRLYMKPGLGHVRLSDLRDRHFEELYAAMRQIGRPVDGTRPSDMLQRLLEVRGEGPRWQRPLSAARLTRVHATVSSALNPAVKRKRLIYNPACHVELAPGRAPRPLVWTAERVARWERTRKRPSPVMVWTPEQTGAFLDFAADDRLYALWHLIAYRGLRRGEALGLPWTDVDLDAGTATIRETKPGSEDSYEDPKSIAGNRAIGVDATTVAVLRAHRAWQLADRLAWGAAWQDSGRVFTREDGSALKPESVSQHFDRIIERYGKIRREHVEQGHTLDRLIKIHVRTPEHAIRTALAAPLPPIRLHDLRHVAASLAYRATRDLKLVSTLMGHSGIQITSDIYTSIFEEVDRDAAEAVAALVPRAHPGLRGVSRKTCAHPVPTRKQNGLDHD